MRRRRAAREPRFDMRDPLLDARPAAELDLHGYTAAEAESALSNFLSSWRVRAAGKVVHIITGKGKRSLGRPVLRQTVARLLKGPLRHLAGDFTRDIDDGGYMVRLRT